MVNPNLKKEIEDYCKANGIVDVNKLINTMLKRGFTIEKHGETPIKGKQTEIVEKIVEVEKEVVKEVPVEKIVEKTVEVPVEKIVEVPVKVSDDEKIQTLLDKISDLEKENADLIDNRTRQSQSIMKANKNIDELRKDYEKQIKELKEIIMEFGNSSQTTNKGDDIYGEGKWGSNLLDE